MTTTVFDTDRKVVSSDSRWSVILDNLGYKDHVWYVDDTGFDKISARSTHLIVLAGDAYLISEWKKWWEQKELTATTPPVEIPPARAISLSIINKQTSEVEFDCGHKMAQVCSETQRILAVFSGSGGKFAAESWGYDRCPMIAIDAAKQKDPYTGGETKYVDYQNNNDNLGEHITDYTVINKELVDRGWIMNIADVNAPVQLNELEDADKLKDAITSGELRASAPLAGQNKFNWTDRQKQRLNSVLDSVRAAEAKQA